MLAVDGDGCCVLLRCCVAALLRALRARACDALRVRED